MRAEYAWEDGHGPGDEAGAESDERYAVVNDGYQAEW